MKEPISVYKIDKDSEALYWLDFQLICSKVQNRINDWSIRTRSKMKEIPLKPSIDIPSNIINTFFSYRFIENDQNKWVNYLRNIVWVIPGYKWADFFDFLILIESNKGNIFAIFWWNTSKKLTNYIDDYFGLDILSRLISPNDERLKSVFEKKITWPIFTQSRNYRTGTSYEEEDFDFWKIFKEISAAIDKEEINRKFWLDTWIIIRKDISFIGKGSLKLWCSVEDIDLIKYIWKIDELLDDHIHPPRFYINEMDSIKKSKTELLWKLSESLYLKLFKNFKIIELSWNEVTLKLLFPNDNEFEVEVLDINHSDIQDYLSAEKFVFEYNNQEIEIDDFILYDINKLFNFIVEDWRIKINSSLDIENIIKFWILKSISSDDKILTEWKLINHITWEQVLDNKYYFIVEWNWFILRDNYISKLKHRFSNVLKENLLSNWEISDIIIPIKWETEWEYNRRYCWKEWYFVFDTFVPDWIELADVIYFKNNEVFILHVKYWFWWSMRDLANQIELSSKRLNSSINAQETNSKDYLNRLYNNAKNSSKEDIVSQFDWLSLDDFITKFKRSKKINYVMTIISNSDNPDTLINSRSNIWKFSLINAYQSVLLKWYWFYVKLLKEEE